MSPTCLQSYALLCTSFSFKQLLPSSNLIQAVGLHPSHSHLSSPPPLRPISIVLLPIYPFCLHEQIMNNPFTHHGHFHSSSPVRLSLFDQSFMERVTVGHELNNSSKCVTGPERMSFRSRICKKRLRSPKWTLHFLFREP